MNEVLDSMKKYILYAGRLDKSKGVRLMFEAWKSINKYDLTVCGIGPEEEWCKDFIRGNSITNIHMLGRKEKNELMPIMKSAQAVIIPTQWYEGFPMTIVESFSNMVPVIGSDIGNVNNIIQERINGLHFKHDSVEDLIRAVNELESVNWGSVMRVPKEYGPDGNYKILMDIYNTCIASGRNR